MPPLSVLDLAPIVAGSDAVTALHNSLALARHAEALGYHRFWVAEHHNMDGVASAATAVLIGQIARATERIRVGSGGIMLPNHAPLTIAEQFGTLACFFPGRIDLGLGRAPGTDGPTMRALRRHLSSAAEDRFPQDVQELQAYLGPAREGQVVRAIPGQGTEVPIWLLGSSLYSAQLAAYLGLPFAFASHFAPELLMQALDLYRSQYRPSARHPKPHAMVGLNVIVADSDEQAQHLFTSLQQRFLGMQRGQRGPLPPPVDDMEALWTPAEKAGVARMLAESVVGSPVTVRAGLRATAERTGADEFIVAGALHDFGARLRSYELLAQLAA
ncbi:LLM class flavin-dependent oxidoreductase [Kinneretia asaccharophila]|uniref:LLM class flavin-dependent oxidoreductase n=1 Tax=Roseateles asaccharophilus TaxID=582607 RepID=UPI0010607B2B|nr:LLM class flavin-dependent oxidoreductase [Roseateles asaccharophilus]MDN3545852.1 LLM class flavin-dependent oxidoreductase [Roseateles asaccharophilus]